MRILVVDDNKDVLTIIASVLRQAGFEPWLADSGHEALMIIRRQGLPHLAVIDIGMPGMDGFELSRRLHQIDQVPIIMLTAQSREKYIVQALDEFAEDYVVKPFNTGELVARINRVLRRIADFDYTIDSQASIDQHLEVDFSAREATVDGEKIGLTPTETKILYVLLRQSGELVTTQMLMRKVWPLEQVPEQRLRVHLSRLRQKIRVPSTQREYIVSERGEGYRFQAPSIS